MSTHIEYQWHAFVVPPMEDLRQTAGSVSDHAAIDRYVVAIEGGESNCFDNRTGKRSRSWEAGMLGTPAQVLAQAVHFAGCCEGGSLLPHNKACKPEDYIARIRKLLQASRIGAERGYWYANIDLEPDHPAAAFARECRLECRTEIRYGTTRLCVSVGSGQRVRVFDFIDRFPDLRAWQLVRVGGLPSS